MEKSLAKIRRYIHISYYYYWPTRLLISDTIRSQDLASRIVPNLVSISDLPGRLKKNQEIPNFLIFMTCCRNMIFHEQRKISEIENPKSAPFSPKIGVWIDQTHKIKKKLRKMSKFLQYRMRKLKPLVTRNRR